METTTNSSSELRIVTGVGGVCEIGSCSAAAVGCCSVAPSPRKAAAAGWVHSASEWDPAASLFETLKKNDDDDKESLAK
ncbi:hypothetical protein CASFOL_034363 [Castilleja foliolosa]|uniref:Uncharacterized protein n=1 Tax=Castilleja foliolosa TaxID=1961234 RepID=A0ABD3BVZ7_9LAMI